MQTFAVSFDGEHCRCAKLDYEAIYQNGVLLPDQITGSGVWYGKDMSANQDKWIYHITESDIKEINDALKTVKQIFIDELGDDHENGEINKVTKNDYDLGRFGETVEKIHAEVVSGQGIYLIRGIPIKEYTRWETCVVYFLIGLKMGTPVSQNGKGHLIGHVKDLGDDHTKPETRIYRTHFKQRFHVDFCDMVCLLCLQQSKSGGESAVASTYTIYNELRKRYPEAVKVLCQDQYWDRKNEVPAGKLPYYSQPIFNFHKGFMCTIFAPTFIEAAHKRFSDKLNPISEETKDAIARFEEIADEVKLEMEFRPGDVQLVNNFSVTHARGTYEDFDNPAKRRHLLRLWLRANNSREAPPTYEQYNGISVDGTVLHAPLEAS